MTILGIWAHPDDEVFVSGGLMANAANRGERVVCLHMTRGEAGLRYGRRCSPAMLANIRERELEASLAHIGVEEQRFYGYPDGGLDDVANEHAVELLHSTLEELEPDVILTFGHDGFTGHPDHRALSSWVSTALALWNEPAVQLLHSTVSTRWKDAFVPALNEFDFFWPGYPIARAESDVTLQLDGDLLDAKTAALQAHASQMQPLFDSYGEDFMRALASEEHFSVVSTSFVQQPCGCMTQPAERDSCARRLAS